MSEARIVRFYLDPEMRDSAEAGQHNFINRIVGVLKAAGFGVEFLQNSNFERMASAGREGYTLFHMEDPFHDRALTMRRNYYYPFWQIERSAKRWEWEVAKTPFDAGVVPSKEAKRFATFWRKRLFSDLPKPSQQGYVYVPLQGRLLQHRSFQTCSPIQMIEEVLLHDPMRSVVATLHPKEVYTEEDLQVLENLTENHPRLSIEMGNMEGLLPGCDYVVSQNSGVVMAGYFLHKPAVLFGQIDFHHIAANVTQLGPQKAIELAPTLTPDYDAYLWWFLQHMSINAGRPEAEDKIAAALRRGGWPV